jgi:hypothetical protein
MQLHRSLLSCPESIWDLGTKADFENSRCNVCPAGEIKIGTRTGKYFMRLLHIYVSISALLLTIS